MIPASVVASTAPASASPSTSTTVIAAGVDAPEADAVVDDAVVEPTPSSTCMSMGCSPGAPWVSQIFNKKFENSPGRPEAFPKLPEGRAGASRAL